VDFHVKCPSCGVIVGVQDIARIQEASVYPNPADDQVTVPFTLGQKADVTVSLSNLLGQVVESRFYQGVDKGKAVFYTASLPSGVYQFTVAANGEKLSGKVVITH
ncbi:MAG: T9SS type A sorting domain-containing protein, partial [Flavipsychrobacter sp.]|nr:T9SS type A sorting domain-containing protein [Flavipsychrobacter sp.]